MKTVLCELYQNNVDNYNRSKIIVNRSPDIKSLAIATILPKMPKRVASGATYTESILQDILRNHLFSIL